MSDFPEGADWWKATDGRWYPPPTTIGGDPPKEGLVAPAETRAAERDAAVKKSGRGCLIGVLVVVALIVALSLSDGSDDEPEGDDLRAGAFDVCTQFVEDRLRAPGSASFPNQFQDDGEVSITGGPEVFTVRSHVDAENGFGGEVRTPFVCQVRHTGGDNFSLIDLSL